jgi:hypothetical protein
MELTVTDRRHSGQLLPRVDDGALGVVAAAGDGHWVSVMGSGTTTQGGGTFPAAAQQHPSSNAAASR